MSHCCWVAILRLKIVSIGLESQCWSRGRRVAVPRLYSSCMLSCSSCLSRWWSGPSGPCLNPLRCVHISHDMLRRCWMKDTVQQCGDCLLLIEERYWVWVCFQCVDTCPSSIGYQLRISWWWAGWLLGYSWWVVPWCHWLRFLMTDVVMQGSVLSCSNLMRRRVREVCQVAVGWGSGHRMMCWGSLDMWQNRQSSWVCCSQRRSLVPQPKWPVECW